MEAQNVFANSRVNITAEGKRHLSAVIGNTKYRDEYVKDLVEIGTSRWFIVFSQRFSFS